MVLFPQQVFSRAGAAPEPNMYILQGGGEEQMGQQDLVPGSLAMRLLLPELLLLW